MQCSIYLFYMGERGSKKVRSNSSIDAWVLAGQFSELMLFTYWLKSTASVHKKCLLDEEGN